MCIVNAGLHLVNSHVYSIGSLHHIYIDISNGSATNIEKLAYYQGKKCNSDEILCILTTVQKADCLKQEGAEEQINQREMLIKWRRISKAVTPSIAKNTNLNEAVGV